MEEEWSPDFQFASEAYWDSYAHPSIHDEMIRDRHRTLAYKRALVPSVVKGKVVLDVGCGTGILSMFAAQAGARKVYAVEMSAVVRQTREIVRMNGFADVIQVIEGRAEDVELPEKVDILVSEWMGYNLMYESMLASVIVARDKWLKPDGILLPDTATMYLIGMTDKEMLREKRRFWGNVYGFDFSAVVPTATVDPMVDYCGQQYLCSTVSRLFTLDLRRVTLKDMAIEARFEVTLTISSQLSGFCTYFDCTFLNKALLSTRPETCTHWKQTCFYLNTPCTTAAKNDHVRGTYRCRPAKKNPRHLEISVDCAIPAKNWSVSQAFFMN